VVLHPRQNYWISWIYHIWNSQRRPQTTKGGFELLISWKKKKKKTFLQQIYKEQRHLLAWDWASAIHFLILSLYLLLTTPCNNLVCTLRGKAMIHKKKKKNHQRSPPTSLMGTLVYCVCCELETPLVEKVRIEVLHIPLVWYIHFDVNCKYLLSRD
jgi:hypothetical protein